MQVIPAIDLKGGKCVRLNQGEFTQVETYTEDPVKYALRWQQAGATRLHMVDLDGARVGMPQNLDVVRQVVRRLEIPVQLGGGIRSAEIVERMLNIGVDRVIVGTSLTQNEELARGILMPYGDKVIVDVAAKDGFVAVKGWQERLDETAIAFAKRIVGLGARRIIFTDVSRDGVLGGVNTEALQEILGAANVPIIASGGVGSLDDFRRLKALNHPNLEGVIVGKALYAGKVDLAQAIAIANGTAA